MVFEILDDTPRDGGIFEDDSQFDPPAIPDVRDVLCDYIRMAGFCTNNIYLKRSIEEHEGSELPASNGRNSHRFQGYCNNAQGTGKRQS